MHESVLEADVIKKVVTKQCHVFFFAGEFPNFKICCCIIILFASLVWYLANSSEMDNNRQYIHTPDRLYATAGKYPVAH